MSYAIVAEINRRLRAAGITVHEWPGWEGRGNGHPSAYVGGIVHHTATNYGMAYEGLVKGRPDLSGPLCNHAGNEDGSLTVIAAGPANHAGASGGRSMGPLPIAKVFNPKVLGLEIVYPGTAPMRPAQLRTAQVWARIVADVVGKGNIECIRAHAETSVTGKWDPGYAPEKTIDMAAFRRAAKDILKKETPAVSDLTYKNPSALKAVGLPTTWDFYQVVLQAAKAAIDAEAIATENQHRINQVNDQAVALGTKVAKLEGQIKTPTVDLDELADRVAARLRVIKFEAQ